MSLLPDVVTGEIGLLIGPHAEREMMLELTAVLAVRGPVQVVDGGNRFDAFRVARLIRRRSHRLDDALNQIQVARAFTCYQVVTLLAETAVSPAPHLIFDLLATFDDDSVSVAECYRLLRIVVTHLQRLRRQAPVIVSIRSPRQPVRAGLVKLVMDVADHLFIHESPPGDDRQMRLFD
ncbi:MAG: hypothetical protein ACE5FD_08915 [Anaerolineae bacterium]